MCFDRDSFTHHPLKGFLKDYLFLLFSPSILVVSFSFLELIDPDLSRLGIMPSTRPYRWQEISDYGSDNDGSVRSTEPNEGNIIDDSDSGLPVPVDDYDNDDFSSSSKELW